MSLLHILMYAAVGVVLLKIGLWILGSITFAFTKITFDRATDYVAWIMQSELPQGKWLSSSRLRGFEKIRHMSDREFFGILNYLAMEGMIEIGPPVPHRRHHSPPFELDEVSFRILCEARTNYDPGKVRVARLRC